MSNLRRIALALLTAVAGCSQQAPPAHPAEPQIAISGQRLLFVGEITRASAAVVRATVSANPVSGLTINSGGGDVEAALEIAGLIRDKQLDVEVEVWCLSSCANYIFPSGKTKTISTGAIVAWHGSPCHMHYLDTTARGSADPVIREYHAGLCKRESEFLRAMGVDPFVSWFGKIAPFDVANFYALSTSDMQSFGIKDVVASDGYGPKQLASLPEGTRRGIVFISADATKVAPARPKWFQ
jgi:ATP-dependent protease ClpP protease subunit